MSEKVKFSILIPIFNEEKCIEETIKKCHEVMRGTDFSYEIIAIDDGSSDRSGEVLSQIIDIVFLENAYNLGYGASLKKGLRHAKGEWIIITDADGTYPIDKIPELIKHTPRYDMVVGSRQTDNDHFGRRPAKWILKKIASFVVGRNIPDLNSGMRVFRKDVAMEFYSLYPSGFSLTSTITLACMSSDYTVKYVDIPYYKRVGSSSINPFHFFAFINLIIKMFLYFKPLRMLSPIAGAILLIGIARIFRDINIQGYIGNLSIILTFTAFFLFVLAFITEVVIISKRK
jgi:glycosyltransferase involved in cell wall biosynthesis